MNSIFTNVYTNINMIEAIITCLLILLNCSYINIPRYNFKQHSHIPGKPGDITGMLKACTDTVNANKIINVNKLFFLCAFRINGYNAYTIINAPKKPFTNCIIIYYSLLSVTVLSY